MFNNLNQTDKTDKTKNISNLEKEYNSTLLEYTEVYQSMMDKLMKNNDANRDNNLYNRLLELNTRLTTLAKNLLVQTEQLSTKSLNYQLQYDTLKNNILQQINNLDNDKNNFNKNYSLTNLENIKNDSYLRLQSNHIKYIVWLLLCITIIILLIHSYASHNPSYILEIVVLIVALIGLYNILIRFSNIF